MEAKVDIRKLQLLNDRINQTIEALHQFRLSVYGLQHASGIGTQIPGFTSPLGQNLGQAVNPFIGLSAFGGSR